MLPEFRYYYFTNKYDETVAFYRGILGLKEFRSWDRGPLQKGAIFYAPNASGLIEIEEGDEAPILQGGLYIQVNDIRGWYDRLVAKKVNIIQPLTETDYGHRSFKFSDPNSLIIGLFEYL